MPAAYPSRSNLFLPRSGKQLMTIEHSHRWKPLLLSMLLLFGVAPLQSREPAQPFDIVITNGHIIDGTGSPWYSGDIGIRDGKIASIGNLGDAARHRTIDSRGMVVAPRSEERRVGKEC